jgi:hypothetical protein
MSSQPTVKPLGGLLYQTSFALAPFAYFTRSATALPARNKMPRTFINFIVKINDGHKARKRVFFGAAVQERNSPFLAKKKQGGGDC